jgi:hypothetical protein
MFGELGDVEQLRSIHPLIISITDNFTGGAIAKLVSEFYIGVVFDAFESQTGSSAGKLFCLFPVNVKKIMETSGGGGLFGGFELVHV